MTGPRHALVLGANGFIGSRLAEHLAAKGWRVDRVVRSCKTLAGQPWESGRTFEIDASGAGIGSAIDASSPGVVFNLAAAGVGRSVSSEELVTGNAGLVALLLGRLDPIVTKKVIHAGSWSQYTSSDTSTDLTETAHMQPPTPYGAAKVSAELLGRALGQERGINFVTLRLFNVYGPGEAATRLIPYVARTVNAGNTASLTSGEQQRDFIHIDDVTSAFEHAALGPTAGSPSFNVATGIGTSVRDIAMKVVRETGADPELLQFGNIEQHDNEPLRVVGDATALRQITGWQPRVSISDGIAETVQWATRMEHNSD